MQTNNTICYRCEGAHGAWGKYCPKPTQTTMTLEDTLRARDKNPAVQDNQLTYVGEK